MFTVVDSVVEFYLDGLIADQLRKFKKRLRGIKRLKGRSGFLTVLLKRANSEVWEYIDILKKNLLTTGGRDFIHTQSYTNTSAGTIGAVYVGVTTDTGAPAAGDTSLASEITTGGFLRSASGLGTPSHTVGTNISTLTITFTATSSFTAIQKGATFNASSAGTMVHENTFTSTNVVANDQLQLVWTMTLG